MTDDRRPQGTRDARVPPSNPDAERALLGAALLAAPAVETLITNTVADDFYAASHQHIAHAIRHLAAVEIAVDVVTVADQLRRSGLLDTIGGTPYLLELCNDTPAISNAPRYATIVHETGVLRRLIGTAAEISALGYDGQPDAIARAGQLLGKLAGATTLSDDFGWDVADIAALLAGDLEPEQPTLLRRTDGGSLLYPGKVHSFQAEPSVGKSWLAVYAIVEALELGGSGVYLDFEDTGHGILRRALQLGASPAALTTRFAYRQLTTRFGPAQKLSLDRLLDELNPDVVIIDGVAEALSRQGLSEDKADDVVQWFDTFVRPIARSGSAVLLLDHVVKDTEGRGRWPRGTGAKLGAIDGASYEVKVRKSFSRHRPGMIDLIVAKDRPGGVGAIGEVAAHITVEPHAGGARLTLRFDPHIADQAPTDTFKPTETMGRLFHLLETAPCQMTSTSLLNMMSNSKPAVKKEALQRLIVEGYIARSSGRTGYLNILKPWNGTTSSTAPAWREPPPELFDDHDEPDPADPGYLDHLESLYRQDNPT